MIDLKDVTTTFSPRGRRRSGTDGPTVFRAVDGVSLRIPRGSVHGIIGFSGAGKSTLLRNVNLLERPSTGEVWVDGVELTGLPVEELRRRRHRIGMIFQGFNLVNNHTAADNVGLGLTFAGVTGEARRTRVLEALDLVDLADKADAYPAQLSGGQKQRVAIARALATEPDVLLCDEPTSALDPFTTATVLQYLADINRELGVTVVVVTHEMEVVRALADDVSVMDAGRIVEQFAVADLESGRFSPTTPIGRYLVSDGVAVERGSRATAPAMAEVA